jgi:hypothetical protein
VTDLIADKLGALATGRFLDATVTLRMSKERKENEPTRHVRPEN